MSRGSSTSPRANSPCWGPWCSSRSGPWACRSPWGGPWPSPRSPPPRRASPVTLIIITIGVDIALRGIALLIWGTDPFPLPPFTAGPPLRVAGAIITRQGVWILGTTALILAFLYVFFGRTYPGKTLRACAINPLAARLSGIRPDRMSLLAFALSAGLRAGGGGGLPAPARGCFRTGPSLRRPGLF